MMWDYYRLPDVLARLAHANLKVSFKIPASGSVLKTVHNALKAHCETHGLKWVSAEAAIGTSLHSGELSPDTVFWQLAIMAPEKKSSTFFHLTPLPSKKSRDMSTYEAVSFIKTVNIIRPDDFTFAFFVGMLHPRLLTFVKLILHVIVVKWGNLSGPIDWSTSSDGHPAPPHYAQPHPCFARRVFVPLRPKLKDDPVEVEECFDRCPKASTLPSTSNISQRTSLPLRGSDSDDDMEESTYEEV